MEPNLILADVVAAQHGRELDRALAKAMDNAAEWSVFLRYLPLNFEYVNCKLPCNCG